MAMAQNDDEKRNLLHEPASSTSDSGQHSRSRRSSVDSLESTSTTSLILENLNFNAAAQEAEKRELVEQQDYRDDESDPEMPRTRWGKHKRSASTDSQTTMSRRLKGLIWLVCLVAVAGWATALFSLISSKAYEHGSNKAYDHETPGKSSGRPISLESVQMGLWYANSVDIHWIAGANGEDGLLLEVQQPNKDFMVVEDIRARSKDTKNPSVYKSKTLMKSGVFLPKGGSRRVRAEKYWPSPDLTKVLVLAQHEKVYRHSFTGVYFLFDVETQTAEFLDPAVPDGRVQLASWSPASNSVIFTRDNNLFVRILNDASGQHSTAVRQITTDGGPEYFYGIPDWVYEEEVFQSNGATWWDREGSYVAFMRTNETMVPEFPIDYYLSRPTGVLPEEGLENYPDEKRIKYPKAGSPNPVTDMLFYSLDADEVFSIEIENGFKDDDRIIADVLWADKGRAIIKEVNRVSDKVRVVLADVQSRSGKTIRTLDVKQLDGGWVEPAQNSKYLPADPNNGRPQDGYIDMVIHENGDHLAYFSPIDNPQPKMLTSGDWEVEQGSVSLDLTNNLVYFAAGKEHSTQRHVYSTGLHDNATKALVPIDKPGFYSASFSTQAGYAIIHYEGPGIPSQKVISTPSNPIKYEEVLEENKALAKLASQHEMPHLVFTNITADDGTVVNVVEQRPPHFDPKHRYPVLFQLYGGPGSQEVTRRFRVNFQSYVASKLGYLVVTVDGRGTGFIGRKARTIIRGNLGRYEARDQITAAKIWAEKKYVDEDRIAIWGWSYGGFMTLKVLETDAGQTFKYGMAVAPVTDWRFYDSVYTERYMLTPQENPSGYQDTAISNVTALSQNVRWLVMHGTGDDNVHMQNTLTLIDKLDLQGIKNYDVHFFPDSDHSIGFHGANDIVYSKLSQFLINAFNGQFYKMQDPRPEMKIGIDTEEKR